MTDQTSLPLAAVRVVELGDAVSETAARLLADLGADTLKLEPVGGAATRHEEPVIGGTSLPFAVRNANKRGAVVDLGSAAGVATARTLVGEADIAFVTPEVADLLALDELVDEARHPVVVISSPFGRTGPRHAWQATERTLVALSGALSRSGRPGGVPLLPPDGLAHATAAAQTAWAAVVALTARRRTGRGQVVDLSHHEAVVTGLDPAFGVQGSAAAGRSGKVRRDRPPADSYPVYRCADGHVRLCLLARRQWRGMFEWLGEPAEFADPAYDSIAARVAAADRLDPLIAALFAEQPGAVLVEEAARRGVPLAQVLSLGDAVAADHFAQAGTVREVELASGLHLRVPVGCVDVDGARLGIRTPSPDLPDESTPEPAWATERPDPDPARHSGHPGVESGRAGLPFEGLRVLDLGVIVFGAEAGRALADLGADVVKVESLAFPDGLRQTRNGDAMNASFAWGQRNKRSLGLDLRSDEGRALFLDLAERCDVVLSNFKPGTLESLGIGHEVLASRNPRLVVLESAAFHSRGRWARRLGYGPLVRAACGVSSLWKYDAGDTECWDGVTVFPDHVAARVAAVAVASALLAREDSGRGCHLEVGQSDVVLWQLAARAALESLSPGAVGAMGNQPRAALGGVFACLGDDEWCVIEARTPREVDLLARTIGAPLRAEPGGDLVDAVVRWAAARTPHEAMTQLQDQGLPAAAMLRLPELLEDPQLAARGTFTTMQHPALTHELPTEASHAPYGDLPAVPLRPAPMVGEHTRAVLAELLGIDDGRCADLLARGIVHEGGSEGPSGSAEDASRARRQEGRPPEVPAARASAPPVETAVR